MIATFWMDGLRGHRPSQMSDSLEILETDVDSNSLYAVFGTFEGEWSVMKFDEWDLNPHLSESPTEWNPSRQNVWQSSLDQDSYRSYVEEIRLEIAKGWVYQVNACRLLSTESSLHLSHLFGAIQRAHKAPAAGYWRTDDWEIASASPETFFKVENRESKRVITTRPIKGTSRDGTFSKKDSAENVMIVDLMRNDISPLCRLGTVSVPSLLKTEAHPGLFHLVSDVQGELRDGISWREILERLSPAGSISGAPKSSALEVISRWESYRGAYCGTLGWIHNGQAHFSVLIRTFFKDLRRSASQTLFGTGAGITWGSDPDAEWRETELKAERLVALASGDMAVSK